MQPRQPRVEAVGGDELCVRALLDDLARLHHQDAVAGEHGRQPVRDDEGGAVLHQPLERGLYQRLALGVERGRRLVEQEERRLAQDGAGNGDALALAARQRHPTFADRGIELLRQQADELQRMRELGRALDLGIACAGPAETNVVADRGGKDHRVLRHQRDAPA